MPEQSNSQALVPVAGEYMLTISEFDSAGKKTQFAVPIPNTITASDASVMLRAAILKQTSWKASTMPTIIHAVMYADKMGLDIMAGDVYTADGGRIATTAGAKIRHAMGTGRIKGYEVEIVEGAKIVLKSSKGEVSYEGPDLTATVKVSVAGWEKQVVYKTNLREWFVATNPNWRTRPQYMLRRNALSKALEEVAPMGVDADEAPPSQETGGTASPAAATIAAIAAATQEARQ